MKVASIEVYGEEYLTRVRETLGDRSPDVAVLPERPVGEPTGPEEGIGDLVDLSEEMDLVLAGPLFEREERLVAPLVDGGSVLGFQEKMHLYGYEKEVYGPGGEVRVFDSSVGRLGIAICFDLTFPEYVRRLCLDGAELVLVPAHIAKEGLENWSVYLRSRALENKVPIAAANSSGASGGRILSFSRGARTPFRLREIMTEDGLALDDVDTEWASDLREERLSDNRLLRHSETIRARGSSE